MAETVNVTGRWAGHYEQRDGKHPIAAELVQDGDRLTGTMQDSDTHCDQSVFETAVEAGLPPGADEQIFAHLREAFPDASKGPIRFTTELPPSSLLEGEVQDGTVSFLKTYQGEHRAGYRIGDQFIGETIEQHQVHYRGRLSTDGQVIEGRWWIPTEPRARGGKCEGPFLLRRQG
jgi:hypothetical protein